LELQINELQFEIDCSNKKSNRSPSRKQNMLQTKKSLKDCLETREVYLQMLIDSLPSGEAHTLLREDSSSSSAQADVEASRLIPTDEAHTPLQEDRLECLQQGSSPQDLLQEMQLLQARINDIEAHTNRRTQCSSSGSLGLLKEQHKMVAAAYAKTQPKRKKGVKRKTEEDELVPKCQTVKRKTMGDSEDDEDDEDDKLTEWSRQKKGV
jgi:hypothetical protein